MKLLNAMLRMDCFGTAPANALDLVMYSRHNGFIEACKDVKTRSDELTGWE